MKIKLECSKKKKKGTNGLFPLFLTPGIKRTVLHRYICNGCNACSSCLTEPESALA